VERVYRWSSEIIFASVVLAVLFCIPQFVHAQESGIKLIPASIEKLANPGDVLNEEVKITNVSGEDKEYFIYKRDIIGVEDGGVPLFAEEGAEKTGFEITEWVSITPEPITVKANETVTLPITITVPQNASPGSHFGGVFVSLEPPKMRQMGAGVGYEVATILSIRINGDVIDDARVRSFSTDKLFYSTKNVNFAAKIENQGNILIRPRGPLEIKSMLGGDPTVIPINEDLAGVFPRTVRELTFSWNDEGIGFGRYEAILALSYDGEGGQKTIDASVTFWVFPIKVVLPILFGFLAVLLIGYFLTRYYINQAIMRAQGGRRITTYRYRRQVGISRFTFVFVTLVGVMVVFLIILLIVFA
jgi:hypothetical protein